MNTSNPDIADKIRALFAYRRFPELIEMSDIIPDPLFLTRLSTLQQKIYALDYYLETTWNVKKKDLRSIWKLIDAELKGIGVPEQDLRTYTRDILRYQQDELDIRAGILPLKKPFRTTYRYKSCDVKLIRRLIFREYGDLRKLMRRSDWDIYDLVTEINDDIEDLYEDCNTINGNRFMVSLLVHGKRRTMRDYRRALASAAMGAKKLTLKSRDATAGRSLYLWTLERIAQTEVLLNERMSDENWKAVYGSILAQKTGLTNMK